MSDRDLFGGEPAELSDPNGSISIAMLNFARGETDKAWFLSKSGRPGEARHAPKSRVSRGTGEAINVFTMPRWLAHEKGWL